MPCHISTFLISHRIPRVAQNTPVPPADRATAGIITALLLLTAAFYADAVTVVRASRAAHAITSSLAAAAMAFAVNRSLMAAAAAAETESLAQLVMPASAAWLLCVVGTLLGIFGARGSGSAGEGGARQLPMFAVKTVGDDGDVTDDEHTKQVRAAAAALWSVIKHFSTSHPPPLQPHGGMSDRAVAMAFFRHIKRDKSAKRIFAFLSLNFCFMSVVT